MKQHVGPASHVYHVCKNFLITRSTHWWKLIKTKTFHVDRYYGHPDLNSLTLGVLYCTYIIPPLRNPKAPWAVESSDRCQRQRRGWCNLHQRPPTEPQRGRCDGGDCDRMVHRRLRTSMFTIFLHIFNYLNINLNNEHSETWNLALPGVPKILQIWICIVEVSCLWHTTSDQVTRIVLPLKVILPRILEVLLPPTTHHCPTTYHHYHVWGG